MRVASTLKPLLVVGLAAFGVGTQPNTTLPINSLYKTNPTSNDNYVVEAAARFINNKTWLCCDFMTKSLSLDPTDTQKRLGDGFYEQNLIREQVAELTGRSFLADYARLRWYVIWQAL